MIDQRELAWAAGLFEGEGTIGLRRYVDRYSATPSLFLCMTDFDTVQRFALAIGFGRVYFKKPQKAGWKPSWVWGVTNLEHVQATLAFLWFGLGTRRRARATEVLLVCNRQQDHRHDSASWRRRKAA